MFRIITFTLILSFLITSTTYAKDKLSQLGGTYRCEFSSKLYIRFFKDRDKVFHSDGLMLDYFIENNEVFIFIQGPLGGAVRGFIDYKDGKEIVRFPDNDEPERDFNGMFLGIVWERVE